MVQKRETGRQVTLLIELSKRGWSDDIIEAILEHMPSLKRKSAYKEREAEAAKILEVVLESTYPEECLAGLEAM